jgi:hypothetical protein
VQEGDAYFLVDLGSTNGTELNGKRVTPRGADRRRPDHTRRDRTSSSAAREPDVLGALDTEQTLLALKIAFLVLLYLFIWAVVRSVTRDLRSAPQESIILSAQEANEAPRAATSPSCRRPWPA